MSIFGINEAESNIKSKSILNMINEDTYLTGDIHFNHASNDNDTYYDEVVESINSRVSTGSCLILMGDICDSEHDGTDKKVFTKFINDINCKNVILVLGNNDRLTIEEYKEMGIKYINTRIDYDNWVFTHEPITVDKGVINFHAHIHGSREYWNTDWHNHIDVFYKDHGCQVLTIKEYLKLFKDGKYDGKTIIKAPHESCVSSENISVLETFLKSETKSNFKSKDTKSLNDFTKVSFSDAVKKENIPVEMTSKERSKMSSIKQAIYNITKEDVKDIFSGYVYYNDNEIVAIFVVSERNTCGDDIKISDSRLKKNISYIDLDYIEIDKKYRGMGLSKQIIDIAVKEFKVTHLCVHKDNEIAKKLYLDYGFEIYNFEPEQIMMRLKSCVTKVPFKSLNKFDIAEVPVLRDYLFKNSIILGKNITDPYINISVGKGIANIDICNPYADISIYNDAIDYIVKELHDVLKIRVNNYNTILTNILDKKGFTTENKKSYTYYIIRKDILKEEYLTESILFNKEDITINFDRWRKGTNNNILFVTGLSGSGKTTLSREFKEKYNACVLEIDGINHGYDSSKKGILNKIKEKLPEYKSAVESKWKDKSKEQIIEKDGKIKLLSLVTRYAIEIMHEDKETLYILDGIQIFKWLNPEYFKDKPVIIKGTSMLKSFMRRYTQKKDPGDPYEIKLFEYLSWFIKGEKELNKFKKEVLKEEYLIEAAWKSSRRYRCPYCDYVATKAELILHLEKKHEDMIPEGYSAGRVLFEFFNKKDHGICRVCGKPTKWNENKLMFEQICDNPKCKKAYSDEFHKVRMVKKYGVESLLNDPKMQQKMLANRKISGYYKFSDGVKISYCGKYELKLLEFCDKILEYKSYEITSPGPVIEYEYEGKTLKWITDQYIGPANLVIDAKDGGDNPNKREMPEYRAKQIAKEEAIKKLRKYNYIRLTDNNFAQLIEVLMDIKFELSENPIFLPNPVININEDAGLASGPIGNAVVGMDSAKHMISYKTIDPMFNSSNNQYALSFDDELNDLYVIDDDGKVKHESVEFLFDKKYSLIKPNNTIYKKDLNLNETVSLDYFLNLCNTYQLESTDIYRTAVYESEIECATLKSKCMITKEMEDLIDIGAQALPNTDDILIKQDPDGFFLYNTITELRTASRSDKNKLLENEELISIIKNYKNSQED